MPRKIHTAEETVAKLRQVELLLSQGKPAVEAVRAIGVTEATYWRCHVWTTPAYQGLFFSVAPIVGVVMSSAFCAGDMKPAGPDVVR